MDVLVPSMASPPEALPPSSTVEVGPSSRSPAVPPHSAAVVALIVLAVSVIVMATVVGNVLVVVAVLTSRALKAPQNLFLVSLASADILVATLVIPFSLANEVMGYWYFGTTWCSFYLALDVLFCTSSIVHLCAISLDRYWSVTNAVSYNRQRTPKRIKAMISVVWLISVIISSPPLLMSQKDEGRGLHGEEECLLNDQTWYILVSCLVSFFVPGVIMILVYCKIYRVAKQRASTVFVAKNVLERQPSQSETCFVDQRKGGTSQFVAARCGSRVDVGVGGDLDDIDLEEKVCEDRNRSFSFRRSNKDKPASEASASELKPPPPPSCASLSWASSDQCSAHFLLPSPVQTRSRKACLSRTKMAQQREKRFTLVLAVVMGAFVLCWFPFFFTYSLQALCREKCSVPDSLFNLFFWIGYCNSCLNPLIYTVFNRDFRRAFKKILFLTRRRS
ncbi:alpha-2Db adrenergic receptor-like [Sphaeramia orbicularis]|uniref:alpha-2Db adrenergic receptor-like n=1 Tax=Sphaeramia orbicularis TaxID=375764 RepID=UPI00117E430A|nr:alpha-2Db adrenergic receptor-like [Sphaeramia orbicularis]